MFLFVSSYGKSMLSSSFRLGVLCDGSTYFAEIMRLFSAGYHYIGEHGVPIDCSSLLLVRGRFAVCRAVPGPGGDSAAAGSSVSASS